jgi:hypothetical protein
MEMISPMPDDGADEARAALNRLRDRVRDNPSAARRLRSVVRDLEQTWTLLDRLPRLRPRNAS